MSKITEVFTSKEMERKIELSNQHIRRLIKEGKIDLIENVDYRKTQDGVYLYANSAVEKFEIYKATPKNRKGTNKESETE